MHNEATRLNTSYWREIIDSSTLSHVSFTFVDDGSLDDTLEVIEQFEESRNVETMRLKGMLAKQTRLGMPI